MANLHVNLAFSADTGKAKTQIQELQTLLSKIAYTGTTGAMQKDIQAASAAAKDLQFHLNNAFNTTTGKFDLSLLDRSLKTSGANITDLSTKLLRIGPDGQQAFLKLAQSISLADQPMFRISNRMKEFAVTMKNTVKWQLSSSMLHGFMGAIQSAYGYAQDLNKSLTDIRIVTGYSADQMAIFAEQANKAAKSLSTTTTDYTNASLIYFQQGLSDAEVAERTEVTVKMANAAGQTAQIVSDQMTAVWNNFYDGSKSLEYYADVMTALGAATATSTDEIAQGLSKFAAVADTVGLSYEFATAALATITSNTRESADVVGNALKTLFSRIQGLQLGETLEDGVDLNKYSEALAKIGVDVIDANGNLIAMDEILTNMASKWDGLTDSQKVATAETVAGVRQYTQLMALMENWDSGDADSFMANLNTIENADGTLGKQAEIYAQSWEAASKRVKAASEGIYQNLLDDKFFINLNNGFADLLGGLNAFIENAGGVKTVLLGIGSTVLTVFSNQIPKALDTLKYNLSILTKGSNEAYQTIQSQMKDATDKAFAAYQDSSGNKGIQKDSAMGFAITQANQLTEARNRLAAVSDRMSDADRQAANVTLGLIQAHQDETIALKQKNEAMQQSISLALESMKTNNAEGLNDYNIDRGLRASSALKKHEGNDYHIGLMPEQIEGLSEVAMNLGQTINEQIVQKLEKAEVATKGLSDGFNETINIIKKSNNQFTEFGELMNNVGNRLNELTNGSKFDISDSQFGKIKQQAQEFIDILPSGVTQIGEVKKALNALNSAKNITELSSSWKELEKVLSGIKINAKNAAQALEGTADSGSVNALSNNMRNLHANTQKATEQTTILKRLYAEFNPTQTIRMSTAMGSLAGMAGNVVTIFNSLKSTFETLSRADTTGMEKFMAILSAIAFTTPAITGAITNYARVVGFLKQEYAKASAAATAAAAANANYGQMIHSMNLAIQSANLNLPKMARALNIEEKATMKAAMASVLKGEMTEKAAAAELQAILIKKGIPPLEAEAIAAETVHNAVRGASVKATFAQMAAQLGLNAAMLPYIAILAAIGIGIGVWINKAKKEAEAVREGAKAAREAAAAKKEEVEANEELVNSYSEVLNKYNSVKSAFDKGEATAEDLIQAQNSLADSAYEVANALGVEGAALAQLSGDYEDLTFDILTAQKAAIEKALVDEQNALDSTGAEFLTDIRGNYKGDRYNTWNDQRANEYDKFFFPTPETYAFRPGEYEHVTIDKEGITLYADNNLEDMIALYEEVLSIYNEAKQQMNSDEEANSVFFNYLEDWLDSSRETYDNYIASQKRIEEYKLQLKAFEKYGNVDNAREISSLEEYEEYSSGMIDALARSKGIKEGTEEWNELANAVHTYLSSLDGVEEFATKSKAFDEIAEKTNMSKQSLLDFYNNLSDEDKELFFQINFDRADTITEFKNELEYLKNLASLESIKVSIDLVKSGEDLVGDGDTTIQQWIEWAKQIGPALEDIGIDFDIGEFLSLTEEEQLARLAQYESMLEQQESLERESAIRMGELRIQELSAYRDKYAQMYEDDLHRLQVAQKIQEAKEDGLSKTEVDFDYSGYEYLWDNNNLEGYINNTKDRIETYEATIGDLNKTVETVEGLKIEKDIEKALGWREDLQKEAKIFDIDYNEVKEYAEHLRETNSALKDNIELSEQIALAEKKQAKGADDLIDNYKDYVKVLKKARIDDRVKDTEEYSKAIKTLRKDLSLLTGYEEEIFTDEFINSDDVQKALKDVSNGVDGATERLKVLAAAQEIKIKTGIEVDQATLDTLQAEITNLNNQDIEIGATIDEAPALDALASLLQEAGFTASQIQSFFNNLGWQPEISYEEVSVSDLSEHESGGYVEVVEGNPYEGYTIVSKPVSAFSGMRQDEKVRVPKLGSKSAGGGGYKKVDPMGNSSSKAPPGGGGGGGQKKHAEKKNDSDKERYHTITNQLEDLKDEYDEISEAADRAFGQDKLDAIDDQIDKTDELIDKQEEYLDAISENLPKDKAIMDAYYNKVIGGPKIEYDERGNIANFDEIQDAMFAKYNKMAGSLTEDSEAWQQFEKQYEQLEKYIQQYEETYDLLREEEAEYQELLNQRLDLQLEKVEYGVELNLNIDEDDLAILEFQLDLLEDKAFESANRIALSTKQASNLYDQILINQKGLEDALGLSLSPGEIAEMMQGDMSVLEGKTFTEAQIDAIKDYRNNLLDLNSELVDIQKQVEEEVLAAFDEWHEELDRGIEKFDHYGNILESYKNIVDIVGKDALGLDNENIAKLSEAQVNNSINRLKANKDAYESYQKSAEEAENKMKKAQEDATAARLAGNEELAKSYDEDAEFWKETAQEMNDSAQEAQEELMDNWGNTLEVIVSQFEEAVERAIEAFNDAIYELGGLEGLSADFGRAKEDDDTYLDDYQKIYELSKLTRDINNKIDDTDIIAGKQKLKALLEDINELQEDGVEMSQYDLEYLQATYDLRLAELELEEARNAKNTVRLQKDNEGNWSYVYTQNTDAVDSAQQKYEDALYAMQDLSTNYIDEMSEKLISTSQEMQEALAAVRVEDYASIEEYYAELDRIERLYTERMSKQQAELQKGLDNNKTLYNTDWLNYSEATGYKISKAEEFAQAFSNTMLGQLTNTDTVDAFGQLITSATTTLVSGLTTAATTYYQNIGLATEAAGSSITDFADLLEEDIEAIKSKSGEAASSVEDMATRMDTAMTDIIDKVAGWQEEYGREIDKIINKNLRVIETYNNMIKALSGASGKITISYDVDSTTSSPVDVGATVPEGTAQAATGGYTGNWGSNEGKLAILHQRELILNELDTSNFLQALEITRQIMSVIDIQAKQASLGLGAITASTLKDEKPKETLEQEVHITAEFPNVNNHYEIEEAFNTLINTASQYANRK